MSDLPIIFSAPMIRALLDGRKTMTRRLLWRNGKPTNAVRVKPGDRLWVRESAANIALPSYEPVIFYKADPDDADGHATPPGTKWRAVHLMPRAWSRLTLLVTATKIERLQEISEEDALAEGVAPIPGKTTTAGGSFLLLWKKLHGPDAWDANPECVCLTFTVHKLNISHLPEA